MRRRRLVLSALGLAAIGLGCQVIVGSDVPEFRCASMAEGTCPPGTTCDLSTSQCVPVSPADDGGPAEGDAGTDARVDARPDGPTGPAPIGTACRVDADCESDLCGTSTILTTVITQPTGPVCTKTCCTSADCPASFVCFGAGTGGNYCVAAVHADRTPPSSGGKLAGATCAASTECRSGYCENDRCIDTCCKATDCAAGTTCRLKITNVPLPEREDWACAPPVMPADAGIGDNCGSTGGVCANDACFPSPGAGQCRPSCCGTSSCTAAGYANGRCRYATSVTGDSVKVCFSAAGSGALGSTCTADGECSSGYCDFELKKCAAACCVDADCPSSEACRPAAAGPPRLRCVGR